MTTEGVAAEKIPKKIAFLNLKGGVGKTTLSVNFAAYCGLRGLKTLLVDLDPQTNATFSCVKPEAWGEHEKKNGTVADLLKATHSSSGHNEEIGASDVLMREVFNNVDLVPSHLELFDIDLELAKATARERKLSRALRPIEKNYDVIIMDCPPNLTIPTQNAISYANSYIIPITADYLAGIGISLLKKRVEDIADDLEHKIKCAGIVISRYGRSSYHREGILSGIREQFPDLMLNDYITDRSAISQASADSQPIFESDNRDAIRDFEIVCEEIYRRCIEGDAT